MEENIIKSGKTAVKKPIIFIMILTFLIAIGAYLYPSFAPSGYNTFFKYHVIFEEHDYECYAEEDQRFIDPDDPEWGFLMWERGAQPVNCIWADDDLFSFIYFLDVHYPTFFFIGAIIILICVLFAFLTKTKFYITKTNIYGNNCFKKFNIAFDDIIETTKKGNNIIISTKSSRLKLSPVKNCNEIYNCIKFATTGTPIADEKTTETEKQTTKTVDNIKNILD